MKYDEINRFKLNGYILNFVYVRKIYKNWELMIMSKKGLKSKNINLKTEKNIFEEKPFEFTGNKYYIF